MKKAVHFGPGGIGMGLFGQVFYEAGYETVFVYGTKRRLTNQSA